MIGKSNSDSPDNVAHLARLQISYELLVNLLGLPAGTEIVRVYQEDNHIWNRREFDVIVRHPDLPVVREGAIIPPACPVFEDSSETRPAPRFMEWGLFKNG